MKKHNGMRPHDVIVLVKIAIKKTDPWMNTESIGWAPANPWFAPGFVVKEVVEVEGEKIYVLPLSYFLATKFSAYIGRGANDPIMSHDFEDIIYILDNKLDLVEELKDAPDDVKPFLKEQFELILSDRVK